MPTLRGIPNPVQVPIHAMFESELLWRDSTSRSVMKGKVSIDYLPAQMLITSAHLQTYLMELTMDPELCQEQLNAKILFDIIKYITPRRVGVRITSSVGEVESCTEITVLYVSEKGKFVNEQDGAEVKPTSIM
jgi:hypothetical protein